MTPFSSSIRRKSTTNQTTNQTTNNKENFQTRKPKPSVVFLFLVSIHQQQNQMSNHSMKMIQHLWNKRSRTLLQVIVALYTLQACMFCQVCAYSSFTTTTSQFNNHAFSTSSMSRSIRSGTTGQQPRLSSSRGIMTMKQR